MSPTSDITQESEKVVYKGESEVKDLDNIDEILDLMVENRKIKIKDISGDLETKFKELVNYVTRTYDMPSKYQTVRKQINDKFEDVKTEYIEPSTIQAYCMGCVVDSAIIPASCSAICAGSAPNINDEDDVLCIYTVYIASDKDGEYVFTAMNHSDNQRDVLIYILDCKDANDFHGLSDMEKLALIQKGVEMVNIIGYNVETNENVSVTPNFLPIYDIKTRLVMDKGGKGSSSYNEWYYVGIGLFSLIIVILLVFVFWGMWKENSKKVENVE